MQFDQRPDMEVKKLTSRVCWNSRNLEPTKFVILRIFWTKFGDFVKIWILVKIWVLVKFEILNPKISKFEILNPNTKISNLDTNFLNFDDFCYKFEENFAEIDKIGDISKFEILNPKIQNLKSLTLKSKIFHFDKIWQKIKIPPRWFIITLRFPPKFDGQNFPKLVPIWANKRDKTFFKILKSIWTKITKIFTKIGSHHQNFVRKILKTRNGRQYSSCRRWCRCHATHETRVPFPKDCQQTARVVQGPIFFNLNFGDRFVRRHYWRQECGGRNSERRKWGCIQPWFVEARTHKICAY